MSSSASSAAVGRRDIQPTATKRSNYTALNLQQYKSSAAGGGAGTKHYGTSVHLYPCVMCVCVCVCVCVEGGGAWWSSFKLESDCGLLTSLSYRQLASDMLRVGGVFASSAFIAVL